MPNHPCPFLQWTSLNTAFLRCLYHRSVKELMSTIHRIRSEKLNECNHKLIIHVNYANIAKMQSNVQLKFWHRRKASVDCGLVLVNPLYAAVFGHKTILLYFSLCWNGTGYWDTSVCKARTFLTYLFYTMTTDDFTTQKAMDWTAITVTYCTHDSSHSPQYIYSQGPNPELTRTFNTQHGEWVSTFIPRDCETI